MNKITLIIKREYLTRVKKKSFVIMTLLGPLLMAGLMLVPIWLAIKDQDIQRIEVIDETKTFINQFVNTATLQFKHEFRSIEQAKSKFYDENYTSILYIKNADKTPIVEMYYKKQPGFSTIINIENTIENVIRNIEIQSKFNVTKEQLAEIQPNITVKPISITIDGEEESKNVGISTALGFGGAILIYFFIFMYGVQIMRGVIEEKTSRIVEIIISSVKPFQLMMGKIIGIALVGLTQFLLWALFTGVIYTIIVGAFSIETVTSASQTGNLMEQANITELSQNPYQDVMDGFKTIPVFQLLISFIFYFIGGYLLYGALLAAVGSAVDSEADTQQFMLPITIPLIFSFVVAQTVMENPDGTMAFWLSIIPLTSPIIMMVRIPFGGVESWELVLSMSLLIIGFLGATWIAAKIYRTGILMYGKKITYKELWKWLTYKN
ncbi:MAG: ABC transporter permease [Flavobacteriales bacterium CG_4_10_14_0_2_um_filter_32_8]|nr:MAG: ABC transporter permease [Flavobacteriales bacterium CG_4_10_14_0_2_um_filter_32_8]